MVRDVDSRIMEESTYGIAAFLASVALAAVRIIGCPLDGDAAALQELWSVCADFLDCYRLEKGEDCASRRL